MMAYLSGILENTSEESDATNVGKSDNNKPPKKLRQKRNATQPQEQIKWMKIGTNWTTPKDCVDHDEKL